MCADFADFLQKTMPPARKTEFDLETEAGRAALSTVRNRGADRVVEYVKTYQNSSQHKVSKLHFLYLFSSSTNRVGLNLTINTIRFRFF